MERLQELHNLLGLPRVDNRSIKAMIEVNENMLYLLRTNRSIVLKKIPEEVQSEPKVFF